MAIQARAPTRDILKSYPGRFTLGYDFVSVTQMVPFLRKLQSQVVLGILWEPIVTIQAKLKLLYRLGFNAYTG